APSTSPRWSSCRQATKSPVTSTEPPGVPFACADHRARGHGRFLRLGRGAPQSGAPRQARRRRRRPEGGPGPRRRRARQLRRAARRCGIRAAMPISRAWKLAQAAIARGEEPVAFVHGNRRLYVEMSERVMAIIAPVGDAFEEASIDEAYLDLSSLGSFEAAVECARTLKREIVEREGLTCSIRLR